VRTLKGHTGKVWKVCFNPQGTLLASCSNDLHIKLWNLTTGKCKFTLKGHEHNVSSIAFTPNGDYLVSTSYDKTLRVWQVSDGRGIKTLEGHEDRVLDVSVSEKGDMMISSGNKEDMILWSTDFRKEGSILTSYFEKHHENQIDAVCFAPHKSAISITKCLKSRDSQDSTGG